MKNRLLSILLILLQNGTTTAVHLAEHFEVSLRTIYRDIEKLCMSGVPILSVGGHGGGYSLMSQYRLNNLFLDNKEANTFMSILEGLKPIFGKNSSFNQMILKFENTFDAKENLKIDLTHFGMEKDLKEYLLLIDEALEKQKILIFNYVNRRMEDEERTIEPIKVQFFSGKWYLVGFCLNRQDYRRFKLTRIRNIRFGEPYKKRKITDDELAKTFAESYKLNSITVTLKFPSNMYYHLPPVLE